MKSIIVKIIIILAGCLILFFSGALIQSQSSTPLTGDIVAYAGRIIGLTLTPVQCDSMLDGLQEQLGNYDHLRKISIPNSVPPALLFNPLPVGFEFERKKKTFKLSRVGTVDLPSDESELAFYSVGQLSKLIKSKKISSEELTHLYLKRLKKYGPKLECVVTLTESLSLEQARRADREIAIGHYRGPLHGIPYGAKDLFATRGIKTTWGSVPFKDQVIDEDATVIRKLEDAGAVLVAKLSMGELAWGDVWFGGMTRNPWNMKEGSSGSSAGPASATAAGLVAFSIGTETWGSIISPSSVCGTTGLRPTYGRVSRTGAMALSWSMDKIGPICRNAEDCAIVFNSIHGSDGVDQTVYDYPFQYDPTIKLSALRIGYLKAEFDRMKENRNIYAETISTLRSLGIALIPLTLPVFPANDIAFILNAEAGAAFDELTRTGKDDTMIRQNKEAWPNVFRLSRFIPAVEYIQANRLRYLLIQNMANMMEKIDCYVSPPFEGDNLLITNLTGHPCVVLPNGFDKNGLPTSITVTGKLFEEGIILALAKRYQDVTNYHKIYPKL